MAEMQDFYRLKLQEANNPSLELNRPYSWSNTLASVDGIIGLKEPGSKPSDICGDTDLSPADFFMLQAGWAHSDAILISGENLRNEPETTCTILSTHLLEFRKNILKKPHIQPKRLVLSYSGNVFPALAAGSPGPSTDLHESCSAFFNTKDSDIIIFTSERGAQVVQSRLSTFQQLMGNVHENYFSHVKVMVLEVEDQEKPRRLHLTKMMKHIKQDLGVEFLDVSAGGRLLGDLRELKLLDEIRYTISGFIFGSLNSVGHDRPSMFPHARNGGTASIKWIGIKIYKQRLVFFRGLLEYQ